MSKIYEALDDGLRLRFETKYADPNEWTFQKILEFLIVQIQQVQDCQYLLRNVEDEDWSGSSTRIEIRNATLTDLMH